VFVTLMVFVEVPLTVRFQKVRELTLNESGPMLAAKQAVTARIRGTKRRVKDAKDNFIKPPLQVSV
jgi:hypothetical protein